MNSGPDQLLPNDPQPSLLDHFIATNEVPCPSCNYNLHGLTGGRCPECGQVLELTVGLQKPLIGPWVMTLVAVALAAGEGLAEVGYFLMDALISQDMSNYTPIWTLVTVIMVLHIPALIVVLLLRGVFMQLPRNVQWTIAIVVVTGDTLAFALYFLIAGFQYM